MKPSALSPPRRVAVLSALLCAFAAALVTSCRPAGPAVSVRSPWHGDPAFEVLVEGRQLAPPPSLAGNRFLSGWRGWRDGARIVYAPTRDPVRVEIVNLGGGPRDLLLDLDGLRPEDSARKVLATVAGRALGEFPLTDPLRVALPADLPIGRVAVDLTLSGPVTVTAGGLSSALPAGSARVDGKDLLQSGDALVEWFTPIAVGGQRLVGRLVPPAAASPRQRFEAAVVDAGGATLGTFAWAPGSTGALEFSLPLPAVGPARIRLLASGSGEARWQGLRIERLGRDTGEGAVQPGAEPSPAPAAASLAGAPPKLIVVFVLDALRADAVGHLGAGEGRTPEIDRLASEGVTFTAHRSVAPNTLPSTKSLFSGRVWQAGGGLSLPPDLPTLAELLRAAGYRTACVSGNQNVSATFGMTRGFDFDADGVKYPPPDSAHATFNDNAARARAAAVAWIRALRPGERGFLYVHVIHPHNPYDPPPALAARFATGTPSRIAGDTATLRAVDRGERSFGPTDVARLRGLYAASLFYADGELAGLVAEARRGRGPGEVLIAVTADHGEELADHGGFLHGYTLYEEMLRIPLVLWWPGRLAPARVATPSDTLDLFTTLLAAGGAKSPPSAGGRSLLEPAPANPWREPRFAAASAVRGGIFGARSERFKVVLAPRAGLHWGMGSGVGRVRDGEFVFDLERDPGETVNLAGTNDPRVGWLRAELLRWVAAGGPERSETAAAEPTVDPEARRRLKALGYIGN